MANRLQAVLEPSRKQVPYAGWRSEELAKLAFSRIPSWSVTDTTEDGKFDYAVMDVNSGSAFMVEVKSFSSFHSNRKIDLSAPKLPFVVPVSLVKSAKAMHCPVVLFVFDVDTDHGRFRRLDTLEIDDVSGDKVSVGLPIGNTIDGESMKRLAKEMGED